VADANCLGVFCAARIITDIVTNIADGDDAGHARRDLVQANSMGMRMEPVEPRGMVRWNFDLIVGGIEIDDAMDMGTDNGRAIGRVERQNEDIVAIGRIGRRWIMRRYQHAVGMDVGWIKRQERFVWILRMARVGDRRQLVHEMDFVEKENATLAKGASA
jgi:hypothetical protein